MVFIAWVYRFLYVVGNEAKTYENMLSYNLESLFKLYETNYNKDVPVNTTETQHASTSFGLGKRSFEEFMETVHLNSMAKTDLESYLEEISFKCAKGTKFDVLTWWRANEAKYPILSKMAKDILSIPVTTGASEGTFSAGKRVIDPKRASMKTSTVEMLLCGGDWVKQMYGLKKGSKDSKSQRQSQEEEDDEEEEPLQFNFGSEIPARTGYTTSSIQQPVNLT